MQEDALHASSHTSSRNVTSPNKQEKQSSTEMTESKAFDKNVANRGIPLLLKSSTQPSKYLQKQKRQAYKQKFTPIWRSTKILATKTSSLMIWATNNLLSAESKDDEAAHKNPSKNLLLYQRLSTHLPHLRPLSLQMNWQSKKRSFPTKHLLKQSKKPMLLQRSVCRL